MHPLDAPSLRLRIADCGFFDCGLRIADFGLRTPLVPRSPALPLSHSPALPLPPSPAHNLHRHPLDQFGMCSRFGPLAAVARRGPDAFADLVLPDAVAHS